MVERMLVGLLARGHVLLEGVPGVAKTLAVRTLADVVGGIFTRLQFTPDLMPSDIVGTRVWRPSRGGVRHRARPGLRQPRPRRRDQPRAGQGAVRPAGGDGGAAGQHRRPHLRPARPVPRPGHPEPDRDRGRLPAARGPARPVPAQGRRRPRRRARGADDPAADERATRRTPNRCSTPTRSWRCRRRRTEVFVHHAVAQYAVDLVMATRAPDQLRPGHLDGAARASASAPAAPSASSPRAAPWPSCAAATTCCPPTSPTWPATSSRTGWCSPSTRSPTASTPAASSTRSLAAVPQPRVAPQQEDELADAMTGDADVARGPRRPFQVDRAARAAPPRRAGIRATSSGMRLGPGQRGRGARPLPARRGRRTPHRLERHRPQPGAARVAHPRRARAGHLAPARPHAPAWRSAPRRREGRRRAAGRRRRRRCSPTGPGNRVGLAGWRPPACAGSPRSRPGRPRVQLVRGAAEPPATGTRAGPSPGGGARRARRRARRPGLRVVVTDLVEPDGSVERPVRLGGGRCGGWPPATTSLVVEVVDPRELELPDVGPVVLSTPRPAASARCGPRAPAARSATPWRGRATASRSRRPCGLPAPSTCVLRTDQDWCGDLAGSSGPPAHGSATAARRRPTRRRRPT